MGIVARSPNWRFIARGAALALAALGLAGAALFGLLFPSIPYGPIPDPPHIDQPAGALPTATVGLQVWAQYPDGEPRLAGSGFYLELPNGQVIGVSAAHSFDLSDVLQAVSFSSAGSSDVPPPAPSNPATLVSLYGEPGRARIFGNDLTGDFVLFAVTADAAEGLTVGPDPRGGPQPGERIVLYSGVLGDLEAGVVFRSTGRGAWAIMDRQFEAALSSGAPIFSQHTGQVVGMALVAGQREGRLVLGMHPIGSLVEKGLAAEALILLAELP